MRFADTISSADMLTILSRTNKSLMVFADTVRTLPEADTAKDRLKRETNYILETTRLITVATERQAKLEEHKA